MRREKGRGGGTGVRIVNVFLNCEIIANLVVPRPPAQTLSRSRGEKSPRLRDKAWVGGLSMRG